MMKIKTGFDCTSPTPTKSRRRKYEIEKNENQEEYSFKKNLAMESVESGDEWTKLINKNLELVKN